MDSVETMREPDLAAPQGTVRERRVQAEWILLEQLVALNPSRLAEPGWRDSTFHVTVLATPAIRLNSPSSLSEHQVRIVYPRFFPAVPLELYLADPVLQPNIHPITGFVCLWDQHRVSNTVEHALHKTVAMLGWRLLNAESRHVMQPEALDLDGRALAERLAAPPLLGVQPMAEAVSESSRPKRRRLS